MYEELPAVITIEQAIEANAFMSERSITKGDISAGFASAAHILEGTVHMGGQEHFYFECQSCVCYPKPEKGEMEVYSSTQGPTHTQHAVAEGLGVPHNRISCHVKRIGGGFGGKETRYVLACNERILAILPMLCRPSQPARLRMLL